jgi:hypothetical protein
MAHQNHNPGGGGTTFPDAIANMVESFFCIVDGNHFFVIAVVMDVDKARGEQWQWWVVRLRHPH